MIQSEYTTSPFSINAKKRYAKASTDRNLSGSFSKLDFNIVLDAIRYDCDALLTVDKYAKDQNKKIYTYNNYGLMILTPVELMKIIGPYQGLWV